MVLVGDGTHHRADVEGLLAVGVRLQREDVAHGAEVAVRDVVRIAADVAVDRVGARRAPREALAGRDVGVLVVGEEDLAGGPRSGAQYCAWPLGPMIRS